MLPILTADQMLTPEKLQEFETRFGRFAHVTSLLSHTLRTQIYPLDDDELPVAKPARAFFELVLRPATPAEIKIFKQRQKTVAAVTADDELLKQIIVHPTPEVAATIMKDWAALAGGLSKTIMRLSGAAVEEEGK